MEINDILNKLGLDLTNPEVRRGAMEAIDAILMSRAPMTDGDLGGGGGGSTQEVELDPDLIQPSIKQAAPAIDDDDIEIEDEEDILNQIKHNESEDPIENTNSNGNDSNQEDDSDDNQESTETDSSESSSDDQNNSSTNPE